MILPQLFPAVIPAPGLPLTFLVGAALALVTGDRVTVFHNLGEAVTQSLPVMGILVGVGCFIQVMTLTGMRGELVVGCLELPEWTILAGMVVALPLFGGVSALGSASVLGVPFLLALLGLPEIWVAAGLSMLAALGDLVPPTAIAAAFAAQVIDEPRYRQVLRYSVLPGLLLTGWGLAVILLSRSLAALFTPVS